jgi:hypothetical protein
MPSFSSSSTICTISRVVRPNLERSPPDSCQRPAPLPESLLRRPILGRMSSVLATRRIVSTSLYFSTTMIGVMPSLVESSAISMYSSSL